LSPRCAVSCPLAKTATVTAGTKSYQYDLAGRTAQVTSPSGVTSVTYDDEDRVTRVYNQSQSINQSYRYNGLDTRVQRLDFNAVTRTYRRDGVSPTAPVLGDGTATFTPGISERRGGVSKFLHQDYLGSTKQITGSNQAVTDTRQYDAFGLQTDTTGSTPTPFGFAGGWGYQQDSTGLQLLGHRYYDPSTGRFLTRGPIQDGRNWYGYCDNRPLIGLDPSGLQVGQPGPVEEWIPIWGSGRAAIDDFQNGRWGWGIFNAALAVSDCFLVGTAVKAIGKLGLKGLVKVGGSHTWDATSKWATKTGLREYSGQHLHHAIIAQNSKLGKLIPEAIKNQPFNLKPVRCHEKLGLTSQQMHNAIHGKGPIKFNKAARLWYGTPDWTKRTGLYIGGRVIMVARN
jgi:RHS repeat-associated protein